VVLLPNVVGSTKWETDATPPAFFTGDAQRRLLSADDRVLVIPVVGENMHWHEAADFRFPLVGGGFAAYPKSYSSRPVWTKLVLGVATPGDARQFREFIRSHRATAVVLDARLPPVWRRLVGTLGVRPRPVDGVLLYRLRRPYSGKTEGRATAWEGAISSTRRYSSIGQAPIAPPAGSGAYWGERPRSRGHRSGRTCRGCSRAGLR
jgi:hypothetical protein